MSKDKLNRARPEHHLAAKQLYKASVVPSKKVYKRKPKHKSRGEY